jgi:hypothetical protein
LQKEHKKIRSPDIDSIKDITGLTIPTAVAVVRYTAKIKTEAIMRFGFYTVIKFVKKLLKKSIQSKAEEEIIALKGSVMRMKRETEKSIILHFKDYKENIKFQYIFKLVEAVSNSHYQALLDRFQVYVTDLSGLVDLISDRRIDKEKASQTLKEMEQTSKGIRERINAVREKVESIM